MIQITMTNGTYICWKKEQYTDYMYDGKVFVVIKGSQLVGIYNIGHVREIRVDAQKGGVRMNQLFSPKWWMNQFISCFITMCFIYLIKMIAGNWNIPFVSAVAESV